MTNVDTIFAADRQRAPRQRSLPWAETKDGTTVVIEPKPHWANDMRAFRANSREYCAYADWVENGARARFFGHIEFCGDDLIRAARALVAAELADSQGN